MPVGKNSKNFNLLFKTGVDFELKLFVCNYKLYFDQFGGFYEI